MHNVLVIVRREFLERVRKRSFWIGTLVFPLILVALFALPMLLVGARTGEVKRIAVVDGIGGIAERLERSLEDRTLRSGEREYSFEPASPGGDAAAARAALEPRVTAGDLYGILEIGRDPFAEDVASLYTRNVGNVEVLSTLRNALRSALLEVRLTESKLAVDLETLGRVTAGVELETYQVSAEGEAKKRGFGQAYFGTFAFVMLLYMSMLLYGIATMRGILEEKTTRVMEVLLGSVSPRELMTGKIVGIGLVGLTQVVIYLATAGVLRAWAAGATGGGAVEGLGGALDALTPMKLLWFVVFFLLGYFLYTALFAAVGSVCNSEEEAQNLQTPVVMCLVLPMVTTIYFVGNPDSTPAVAASLFPPFTPMVMYMRISVLTPPLWQILLSVALTGATIWVLFRAVAKVFRIGVLLYGKRPTIPEILRWARS
jgi:ABC-2 type transport system permease protein